VSVLHALMMALPFMLGLTVWAVTDDDPSRSRRIATTVLMTCLVGIGMILLYRTGMTERTVEPRSSRGAETSRVDAAVRIGHIGAVKRHG
jgi:hypothetical protein